MKLMAFTLIIAFTFQSMPEINKHTYTTGFSNFHYESTGAGLFCCFCFGQTINHGSYTCGKSFHIGN